MNNRLNNTHIHHPYNSDNNNGWGDGRSINDPNDYTRYNGNGNGHGNGNIDGDGNNSQHAYAVNYNPTPLIPPRHNERPPR